MAGRIRLLGEEVHGAVGEGFGFGTRVDDLDVGEGEGLAVFVDEGCAAGCGPWSGRR
jgi:hypothetical protein